MCGACNCHECASYGTADRAKLTKSLHYRYCRIDYNLRGLYGEVYVGVLLLYLQLFVGLLFFQFLHLFCIALRRLYFGIVLRIYVGHFGILQLLDGRAEEVAVIVERLFPLVHLHLCHGLFVFLLGYHLGVEVLFELRQFGIKQLLLCGDAVLLA